MHAMYGKAVFDFNAIGGLMELKETSTGWRRSPQTALARWCGRQVDPATPSPRYPTRRGSRSWCTLEHVSSGRTDADADAANSHARSPGFPEGASSRRTSSGASPPVGFLPVVTKRRSPAAKNVDWETWLHAPGMPPVDVRAYYDDALASQRRAGEEMAPVRRPRDEVRRTRPEGASRPTWRVHRSAN